MNNSCSTPSEISIHQSLPQKRRAEAAGECIPYPSGWQCCKRQKCSLGANSVFTTAQRRRYLQMTRKERKIALNSVLQPEGYFMFNGHRVCHMFLSRALTFSTNLIASVKKIPRARASSSVTYLPRESTSSSRKFEVIVFLKRLAESIGGDMPDCAETHLPYHKKKDVYIEHREAFEKENSSSILLFPVSQSTSHDIKVRKVHRFRKCTDCEFCRSEFEKHALNESIIKSVRADRLRHIQFVTKERAEYAKYRNRAVREPTEVCSIIIDGADQAAYGLPHFIYGTKNLRGDAMKVRLIGIKEHLASPNVLLFLMTEEHETGANHIVEALHRFLTGKAQTGALPPTLHVQADNCTRENKNRYIMGYFEFLIAKGVFQEVRISFLPVGHTHEDIDQVFSRTSEHLRHHEALTIEQLASELELSYNPQPRVTHMKNVCNFSGLCEQSRCLRRPSSGWIVNRYFRFVRADSGAANGFNDFATRCTAKVNSCDDWNDLLNGNGFLKFPPNLSQTPPTLIRAP